MNISQSSIDIKVIIADDHRLVRSGIVSLIDNHEGIHVIDEANDGKELIEKYFRLKPDLLLIDISMPVLTGIEALNNIKLKQSDVKALFLSIHSGDVYIYQCLKAGGFGFLSKDILKGELIYAIHKVYIGEKYFGNRLTEKDLVRIMEKYDLIDNSSREIDKSLNVTSREKDILYLVSRGLTSSEIAERLNISKRTVDALRAKLLHKLNLKSGTELIQYAMKYIAGSYKEK